MSPCILDARNQRCPCGSGRKYKLCHGHLASGSRAVSVREQAHRLYDNAVLFCRVRHHGYLAELVQEAWTRVADVGDGEELYGGICVIRVHELDTFLDLLDGEPYAEDLLEYLPARLGPPALVTAEGDPIELWTGSSSATTTTPGWSHQTPTVAAVGRTPFAPSPAWSAPGPP